MANGELEVSGKNRIELELAERPSHIKVSFVDDEVLVPCNPGSVDELEWELIERENKNKKHRNNKNKRFFLQISWRVHSERTIVWHVRY